MPVSIIDSFQLGTDLPLDNRYIVDSVYDVSLYWYAGMQAFQRSDQQLYWYDGSIWNSVIDTSLSTYSSGLNIDVSGNVINVVQDPSFLSTNIVTDLSLGGDFLFDYGNTITVAKTGAKYDNINDAIAVADASTVIFVSPGNYIEDISINKNINLVGSCGKKTKITGKVTFTHASSSIIFKNVGFYNENDHAIDVQCTDDDGKISLVDCYVDTVWNTGLGQSTSTAKSNFRISRGQLAISRGRYSIITSGDNTSEHNTSIYWLRGGSKKELNAFGAFHTITNTTDERQNLEVVFNTGTNSNTLYEFKNGNIKFYGVVNSNNYIAPFYSAYASGEYGIVEGNLIEINDTGNAYCAFNYGSNIPTQFANNTIVPKNVSDLYAAWSDSGEINVVQCYFDTTTLPQVSGNVNYGITTNAGAFLSGGLSVDNKVNLGQYVNTTGTDGDFWYTGSELNIRVGATTIDLLDNSGDVTYAYVDGSLAARDTSIEWLKDNTYTKTYIDGSLNVKADLTYVDASLIARDLEIAGKVDGAGNTATHNPVAYWTGTKTIDDDSLFIFDPTNNRLGIGVDEFSSADPEMLLVDAGVTSSYTIARFKGQIDDYLQLEVKNDSGGPNASADIVASTADSTEEIGYVNLGINSPNYNGSFVGLARDSYLYSLSANLLIGNASTGQDIIFFTNGENAYDNEILKLTSDGKFQFGQPTSTTHNFEVNGDINLPAGSDYHINGIPLYTNSYIDSSLDNRVSIFGDTMTGPLNTVALNVSGDVSVSGSIYLGDTSTGGETVSTDLLAVVTDSGKIVATSIPAGNVSSEVIDVSVDIDVSILSGFYYVDTTAGDINITIPDSSTSNDGKLFAILKKSGDTNNVIVTTIGGTQLIGSNAIQIISQQDKGFTIVSDNDNEKWLISQDSRYLEGATQGEFQYWDVSTRTWLPTSSDITWDNDNLEFKVGGNSTPVTFRVDASSDIVYINALDVSVNNPTDDLGFYAGGRGAFGNSVTMDRLRNNVPGNVPRALSLIDTTGVMRIWRFVNDANDPAVEFVWGTDDAPSSVNNNWWDMFLDGATGGADSFSIRRRTGGTADKLLTLFNDHTELIATTESYDSSTGSLQVAGGAGFKGNINTTGSVNPGGSVPSSAFPDTSTGGAMFFRSDLNQMFVYDEVRTKWLSIDRATYTAGAERANSGAVVYMESGSGDMSSISGFKMPKNGTILGATIQNRVTLGNDRDVDIRINNSVSYSVTISSGNTGGTGTDGNIDFSAGDLIQISIENAATTLRDIFTSFEVAWRE